MIKTALSASLIALAVLAPAASAADEVKPPRHTEPAAVTCRTPAPAEVDPKAPPAPRLTKAELEALNKLPLCPAEQAAAPQEACPPYDKLVLAAETARRLAHSGSTNWPDWLMDFHRPDCGLDLLHGGSEPRNGGGTTIRPKP